MMDTGQARHRMHWQGTGCSGKEHDGHWTGQTQDALARNRMHRQGTGATGRKQDAQARNRSERAGNWSELARYRVHRPETGVNRHEIGVLWPDTECTGQKQE